MSVVPIRDSHLVVSLFYSIARDCLCVLLPLSSCPVSRLLGLITTFSWLGLVTLSFHENYTILNACPYKWAIGLLWINSHRLLLLFL